MSSYLDNLNNSYSSYEDYLHQRSKLPVTSSQIYEPVRRSCYNCDTIVNTAPASKGTRLATKSNPRQLTTPSRGPKWSTRTTLWLRRCPRRRRLWNMCSVKRWNLCPRRYQRSITMLLSTSGSTSDRWSLRSRLRLLKCQRWSKISSTFLLRSKTIITQTDSLLPFLFDRYGTNQAIGQIDIRKTRGRCQIGCWISTDPPKKLITTLS